jgi:hypothetical protein
MLSTLLNTAITASGRSYRALLGGGGGGGGGGGRLAEFDAGTQDSTMKY